MSPKQCVFICILLICIIYILFQNPIKNQLSEGKKGQLFVTGRRDKTISPVTFSSIYVICIYLTSILQHINRLNWNKGKALRPAIAKLRIHIRHYEFESENDSKMTTFMCVSMHNVPSIFMVFYIWYILFIVKYASEKD